MSSAEEKNDLQLDIDNLLERLLANVNQSVQMSEEEMSILCEKSKNIFLQEPTLLELEAPIKICGKVIRSFSKYKIPNNFPSNLFDREDFRSIHWSTSPLWTWWFSTSSQLPVSWWLCWSRSSVLGNNLSSARLQSALTFCPISMSNICFIDVIDQISQ